VRVHAIELLSLEFNSNAKGSTIIYFTDIRTYLLEDIIILYCYVSCAFYLKTYCKAQHYLLRVHHTSAMNPIQTAMLRREIFP
jgi:hypothetical protein